MLKIVKNQKSMFFLLYFCKKNGSNMAISDTKFHNKYRIQSTRAEWHDYNGGLYHVTLCTKNREHYLEKSKMVLCICLK